MFVGLPTTCVRVVCPTIGSDSFIVPKALFSFQVIEEVYVGYLLENVLAVLSDAIDAIVMIITTYFAWKEAKQFREVFGNTQPSLTVVFVRQGIVRFLIIVIWGLEISIATKVENPFLAKSDAELENAISGILVCRFMLELRKLHDTPQTQCPAVEIETTPRFLRRLDQTITEEFGNSGFNYESDHDTVDNDRVDFGQKPFTDPEVGHLIEVSPLAVRETEHQTG